jgi:GTP-binding protein LepA
MDGKVKVGDEIRLMAANKIFTVSEVGYFVPGSYMPADEIKAGEVRIYFSKHKKFIRYSCWRYNYFKK